MHRALDHLEAQQVADIREVWSAADHDRRRRVHISPDRQGDSRHTCRPERPEDPPDVILQRVGC